VVEKYLAFPIERAPALPVAYLAAVLHSFLLHCNYKNKRRNSILFSSIASRFFTFIFSIFGNTIDSRIK
jgi:putative flippase GtrA